MTRRRRVLGSFTALACASSIGLSSCGFELRRAPELHFRTIQLSGFSPRSLIASELRASISTTPSTVVVESSAQAQVVVEALADVREKSVVATTSAGQVREYQLRSRLRFRVRTPAGRELIPDSEILLARDLSYTETAALAKEYEEGLLYRAMETDIVSQLLRRLATIQSL